MEKCELNDIVAQNKEFDKHGEWPSNQCLLKTNMNWKQE